MTKIAICDDSEFVRAETEKMLVKFSVQRDFDFKVKQFESGESFLEECNDFDLLFLDYQFENKGENGIEIARKIRESNKDITIIFLSGYERVVFESFEVDAFRFLVKPLEEEKLFATMLDYINKIKEDSTIAVKCYGLKQFIKEDNIIYIEGDGKNCIIHLANKKEPIECSETLAKVETLVSKKKFCRTHKSFLINMNYVDSYSHAEVSLQNNEKVLISRLKYKTFNNRIEEFILKNRRI
ncbi:LytR/AlgR family response regulator transcription factor [Pseudobutyrivibrio sp.]|uniref:LytR/AlgR family response regulator transcription factor n=1 Tax=Pseudobutyrivibrio sp. TaxID=2014367 RepID=UPI0025FA3E13|nr:LytTR family DNA-binding domain-containing protein [Pseudobutyrivibrio sp.]MBR5648913.1 response regulator transcription factor [Pseudobutyrivibrio sp.]